MMKYKTKRESYKFYSIFVLVCGISICIGNIAEYGHYYPVIGSICCALVGLAVFIYCWTCNLKRNLYRKRGEHFEGRIIGAERSFNGRGQDTYYLLISFYENGIRKIRYTEGYVGNPNRKLKSRGCSIYKYRDRYIETDLNVLASQDKSPNLNIPISKRRGIRKAKEYV